MTRSNALESTAGVGCAATFLTRSRSVITGATAGVVAAMVCGASAVSAAGAVAGAAAGG